VIGTLCEWVHCSLSFDEQPISARKDIAGAETHPMPARRSVEHDPSTGGTSTPPATHKYLMHTSAKLLIL
jgi:hypothetical protein